MTSIRFHNAFNIRSTGIRRKAPDRRRRRRRPYDFGTKHTPIRLFEMHTDRVPRGGNMRAERAPSGVARTMLVTHHVLNELSPYVRKLTFEPLQFDPDGARGKYELVLNRKQWRAIVRTMYKRKNHKMLPANIPLPDDINPNHAPSPASTLKMLKRLGRMYPVDLD